MLRFYLQNVTAVLPGMRSHGIATLAYSYGSLKMIRFTATHMRHYSKHLCDKISRETLFDDHSRPSSLHAAAHPLLQFNRSDFWTRQPETIFRRLRLGAAYGASFLHRINKVGSPNCECGHPFKSVEHLLLECVKYASE